MGQEDTRDLGYPRSTLKRDWQLFRRCGGAGGGGCPVLLTQSKAVWAIETSPFLVRNRNLILQNPEFAEVRIYNNAGAAGLCSYSKGSERTWNLAFGATASLTDAQILAQNNVYSGAAPYDIEIGAAKLPQPTDPSWANKIYVYIYWGASNLYVADFNYTDNQQWLKTVKHDYDEEL